MPLTISEAAELLEASTETIYRWIESRDLPAYRVNDQFRINRTELLEWATVRDVAVGPAIFHEANGEVTAPTLAGALTNGGVVRSVGGHSRADILSAVVNRIDLPTEDRSMLLDLLLARDKAAFVSLPDHVAIPHVRHPIVLAAQPRLYLFLLRDDIEFTGAPVRVLFVLLTPTIRAHLQILARLSYILRDPTVRDATRTGDENLAAVITAAEAELA